MKNIFTLNRVLLMIVVGCLVLAGCKKEKAVSPKSTTPNASETSGANSAYYLTGKLDDETVNITGIPSSYANQVSVDSTGTCHAYSDNDNNGGNSTPGYITGMKWISNNADGKAVTHGSIEMRKLSVRVYVAPIAADVSSFFFDMVAPSSYSFAYNNDPNNGAYITLVDANNVLWTSNGNQDGSTFQIISRGTNKGNYTIVSGVISAKLYDGQGNVKTFNSGAFNITVGL